MTWISFVAKTSHFHLNGAGCSWNILAVDGLLVASGGYVKRVVVEVVVCCKRFLKACMTPQGSHQSIIN
jgi:hypothetical protein